MSLGQEVDEALARIDKARDRFSTIARKYNEELKTIYCAFSTLIHSDPTHKHDTPYSVGKYIIWKNYGVGGYAWCGLEIFDKTKSKKRMLRISCSDLVEKDATYTLTGDELFIQEVLPIWSELLKEMAIQITIEAESRADRIEAKNESGQYLIGEST